MNARMKKALSTLKASMLVVLLMLGMFVPMLQAKAAPASIYDYVTEFSINDVTWKYGMPEQSVVVGHQEPVSVRYTLYLTKTQWETLCQNGRVKLEWDLPERVQIVHVEQDVIAKVDGKEKSIGMMEVVDSSVEILISEEYTDIISHNDNIEINMSVVMQMDEGHYNLGQMIVVTVSEAGQASASWNNYSVCINKIDENNDAKLLDGAYFEIDEYQYSEDAHTYKNHMVFALKENHVKENDTFIFEANGFTTIEDKVAVLEGGFEPGYLYVLRELRAPVGFLPSGETVKFGFYRYTESDSEGTQNKIKELNAVYKTRYENEGGVAAFGSEKGVLDTQVHHVYVKNRKVPKMQVLKLDAMTGEPLEGVTFTLEVDAQKANYTVDQYVNLENAGWEYDTSTGKLSWTMKTDENGIISYPEGTVPYNAAEYLLVEQVPKGYEGYGKTKTVKFKMNQNGSVEVTGGDGTVDAVNGVITIKVENERVAELAILKIDEAGVPLEGAVFALYGPQKRDTDDILKKGGKEYYFISEKTSGKDGRVDFTDLPYGEYCIVEKEAPDGYQILDDAYKVELNGDAVEDYVHSVKIVNYKKGVQIVETGGRGIGPYIAGGAALLVAGSIFFFVTHQKKKRQKARRRAQAARRKGNGRK